LGPHAINETKFQPWSSRMHAIGLDWDLTSSTVSMPQAKIDKALARVSTMLQARTTRRTNLLEVLGSLRHVATCIPAARPFFQRMHQLATRSHKFATVSLDTGTYEHLRCFAQILKHAQLVQIPTSVFSRSSVPDVHLYMDASNLGLVVLDPARRRFIRIKFDQSETTLINQIDQSQGVKNKPVQSTSESPFSINVREYFSLCLAIAIWAHDLRGLHVHAWIDNAAGVAWTSKLAASNSYASELNRHMGLCQAMHRIHVTADHLPGATNAMADAGSRIGDNTLEATWKTMCSGWTAVPVPSAYRWMYKPGYLPINPTQWPRQLQPSTSKLESSGNSGPTTTTTKYFCPPEH